MKTIPASRFRMTFFRFIAYRSFFRKGQGYQFNSTVSKKRHHAKPSLEIVRTPTREQIYRDMA